jgi:hypothetical protein
MWAAQCTSFSTAYELQKMVTCVDKLIGTQCDLEPLKAVYSLNQGHELITPELRGAIDALRPNATAGSPAVVGERWDASSSSELDRWFARQGSRPVLPTAEATAPNTAAASPQLYTDGSARNGSVDGDPWLRVDDDEAREQPPTAATCPLELAVGGGCVPRTTMPVSSPPGLESSAASATATEGTLPKSAPTPAPKKKHQWSHLGPTKAKRSYDHALGPLVRTHVMLRPRLTFHLLRRHPDAL